MDPYNLATISILLLLSMAMLIFGYVFNYVNKFSHAGGGGGGGADFTEDFSSATWQTDTSYSFYQTTDTTTDLSANFVKTSSPNGCDVTPTGNNPRVAEWDYGKTPASVRLYFTNNTSNEKVHVGAENFIDGSNDLRGAFAYYDMNSSTLGIGHYDSSGNDVLTDDTDTVSLSNSTDYYMELTISVAGSTTTITAEIFNLSDVSQGNSVTFGFDNTEFENLIHWGVIDSSGVTQHIVKVEVYDS